MIDRQEGEIRKSLTNQRPVTRGGRLRRRRQHKRVSGSYGVLGERREKEGGKVWGAIVTEVNVDQNSGEKDRTCCK